MYVDAILDALTTGLRSLLGVSGTYDYGLIIRVVEQLLNDT
jgi:hypothetical protein